MNKFWKKILAATLSAATAVTLLVPTTFAKAEGTYTSASEQAGKVLANPSAGEANVTYGTGLQQTKFLQAADDSTTSSVTGPRRNIRRAPSSSSSSSTNRTNSSSDYFYNTLNDNEKAFYDAIDQECYKYLTQNKDAVDTESSDGKTYKTTEQITYASTINSTRANNIASVFRYENPQYYFLENAVLQGYSTSGTSTTYYVKMVLFDDFASGSARSSYTTKFNNAVNEYLTAINEGTTYYDKEKIAHDLLIKNIVYNTDAKYNQSSCSGLVEKATVCMGYAASFQLLMNRVGIETIVVSSSGHAWNEIKLDGNWYVVDVTWDDPLTNSGSPASGEDSNKRYLYFNISDTTLSNNDDEEKSHTKDSMWDSFSVPACPKDYDTSSVSTTPVSGITLDKSELSFTEGDTATQKLTATILPATATNTKVNWKSEDANIAKVDSDGNVTAVGAGTTNIVATADDNSSISAKCSVTVNKKVVKVTGITISGNNAIKVGETSQLSAIVEPSNADAQDVSWASNHTDIATISDDGLVKAVAEGTTTITATAKDGSGVTGTYEINVSTNVIDVQSVTLSQTTLDLKVGDSSVTLTATVAPDNATNKKVTWSSSNANVATVDQSGKVTAVGKGTAKITVKTEDGGKTAECTVTVTEAEKPSGGDNTGESGGTSGGSTGGSTGGTTGGSTGGTTGGTTGGSTGGTTGGSTGNTGSTGGSTSGNSGNTGSTSSNTSTGSTSTTSTTTSSTNTNTTASSSAGTTPTPSSTPSERTINTTPTRDEIAGRNLVSTVVVQPTATDDGGIKHQDVYVQSDIFKINQALESLSKNKLIRSLTRTKTVTIDMKQGASVPANIIPKEVLQTAEGQKVNLKFDMGDYSWTIKGKDITDAGVKDINLGLNETSAVIPEAVLKSVSGKNSSTQFSIKHSGEFGFQAKLTLYVGKQYRGKYANFYTYDGNNIELSGYAKVNRKGYVTVDFNHGPYYGIVFSKRHAKPSK